MKVLLQRVTEGSVTVDGEVLGAVSKGLVILFGAGQGDTDKDVRYLAEKCANLRIFCDDQGKMNLSLLDIDGEALVISQFTLLANYRHGNRPDFLASAKPDEANRLYEYFISLAKKELRRVECGVFGADMKVRLLNDGPVTITMDTDVLKSKK